MPTRTFEIEYGASAIRDLDTLPERVRIKSSERLKRYAQVCMETSNGCMKLIIVIGCASETIEHCLMWSVTL